MKVMDRLGNQLKPGDTVYFGPLEAIVVVLDVEEPGKIQETPGCLSLGIKIPFTPDKDKTDVLFRDLMKVHTPDEGKNVEDQINEILAGRGVKPVRVLNRKVGGTNG
jgi:hypothetical protein